MGRVTVSFNCTDVPFNNDDVDAEGSVLIELNQESDLPGTIVMTDYYAVLELRDKLSRILEAVDIWERA